MTSCLPNIMMLLALICTTALAATYAQNATNSSQNLTSTEHVDLNKTILEVEKILDKYPELPRIERSEILTILQNITEEDNAKLKEELSGALAEEQEKMKLKVNSTRAEGKKSVMVVLPFKPEDERESLEELYTRSPVVIMEEQKQTADKAKRPLPSFSIVEKEDPKFNPPLRVIGFRYHTTHRPNDETTRSYTNFQDPEQVTMAFREEEATTRHWNHRETPATTKPAWGDDFTKAPAGFSQQFHVPDAMDNFSLEDVMLPSGMDQQPKSTTERAIEETTKDQTTTQKVYITSVKPRKRKTTTTTTTTTTEDSFWMTEAPKKKPVTKKPVSGMGNALDNLPPHMKEMLNSIGISDQSSLIDVQTDSPPPIIRPANADINPASFSNFRPLPLKKQKTISEDMQSFLASFGLFDNNRQQKSAPDTETTTVFNDRYLETAPKIHGDFLTDTMKKTLENLGLYDSSPKSSRKHIFNPQNHTKVQSDEEIKKLNTLLTTIKKLASLNDSDPVTPEFQKEILQQVKELDNITISYKTSAAINEEIHKIMEKNKGKFKIPVVMKESTLLEGPDPEYFEDIQLKNEVKRQEENATSTTEAGSSSTTEPANSAALEDSFGGGGVAPADADPAESLPPKRPNGLYLLLDWNTFFEVGTEDDNRRVNIRFQPKIGDGRNFLPVTIP